MKLNCDEIDISNVAKHIPYVMNALYNQEASEFISVNIIRDAFRTKQLQSKQWLMHNFQSFCYKKNYKVLVVGGWLGFTSYCLYNLGYTNITEVDLDPEVAEFSKHLNRFNKNFNHITADINHLNLNEYDVIVNTSCEHIQQHQWFNNLYKNKLLFLQSTDLQGHEHTNIVQSITEMQKLYKFNTTLYSGQLECGSYNRFMIIGIT